MKINLSPVLRPEPLALVREGDKLYLNGQLFDFSQLLEGSTLPEGSVISGWFPGPVDRIDGELHLTIRLPHALTAPESTRFPAPITVTEDGPIILPVYEIEVAENE